MGVGAAAAATRLISADHATGSTATIRHECSRPGAGWARSRSSATADRASASPASVSSRRRRAAPAAPRPCGVHVTHSRQGDPPATLAGLRHRPHHIPLLVEQLVGRPLVDDRQDHGLIRGRVCRFSRPPRSTRGWGGLGRIAIARGARSSLRARRRRTRSWAPRLNPLDRDHGGAPAPGPQLVFDQLRDEGRLVAGEVGPRRRIGRHRGRVDDGQRLAAPLVELAEHLPPVHAADRGRLRAGLRRRRVRVGVTGGIRQ